MNRTNVPQEFEVVQRESQQALVILGDLIAELEKAPKRGVTKRSLNSPAVRGSLT